MKKVMTFMMMAVVCLIMASCSSKPDPKDVADKIAAGQTLTEADYSTIIDYCGSFAEKAQPYYNVVNSDTDTSSKEYIDAVNELASMWSNAVYLPTFSTVLRNADAKELGEKNVAKADELSKFLAFPIPNIPDSPMMNPDVVGDIVDMPSSDTSNVIATGDGEVVIDNQAAGK